MSVLPAIGPVLAAATGEAACASSSPFRFDPGLWLWTLVSFLVVLVGLARFAFKPMAKAIEAREKAIRDALDRAAESQRRAEQLLSEQKQLLEQANKQARDIVAAGQAAAERSGTQIIAAARDQTKALLARAQEELETRRQQVLRELRDTVANLSVQIATQILRREVKPQDHNAFVKQFLDDLRNLHDRGPPEA